MFHSRSYSRGANTIPYIPRMTSYHISKNIFLKRMECSSNGVEKGLIHTELYNGNSKWIDLNCRIRRRWMRIFVVPLKLPSPTSPLPSHFFPLTRTRTEWARVSLVSGRPCSGIEVYQRYRGISDGPRYPNWVQYSSLPRLSPICFSLSRSQHLASWIPSLVSLVLVTR